MRLLLAATLLAAPLLAFAGAAAAQTETPAPLGTAPSAVAAPDASAAAASGRRQPRRVDGAQAAAKPAPAKADAGETLRKAQAATAARDKAWDARMKRTLGSICHGC
ncbi:hypothetical protein DK419_27585 [Methylobacterium terrae]|uniref:Uncharacterized protein n=1 Tax=Methylobacterium terrae TaxID=2202827 RepID=A0A2U8WU90_9HYPH|nr:hypothetical protein [Methylobacterium terrae]AWN49633.1 hypothetical protein DK419_27585 [Methylobacterium terrae]